jgi:hypothetical protein
MKKALLLLVFSMSCVLLSAQPDETPPPDPFNGDPDNAVPITGLEWLLAGGVVLGLKKIIDTRKNAEKEE